MGTGGAGDGLETRGEGLLDRILEELKSGRRPDEAELAARYPDLADDVPRLIGVVDFVHGASQSLHPLHDIDARLEQGEEPVLGEFRIRREVSRGGMGIVYEAEQLPLARRVALKVLLPGGCPSPRELERFRREARTASRLTHAHIVAVHAVGEFEGVPYYAMEFVDGPSLADLSRERRERAKPDPEWPRRVARWGKEVAAALSHAHLAGVIHRDVKPSNVLIDESDTAWVTDFGLARRLTDATLTVSGDLIGTLRYMSPEQARGGGALDERTDVYSLGATLYELLAGRPPFTGEEREEILRKVLLDEPAPLAVVAPEVPEELATIVHQALAKRAEERYPSADLLAEDLERFLGGRPILARPPTLWEQLRALDRRHRFAVRSTALTGLLLLVLSLVVSVQAVRIARDRERLSEESARATHVRNFLESVLFYTNPKGELHASDLDALLDRVAANVEVELADDPGVCAELLFRLGDVYWTRSRFDEAQAALAAALEYGRAAYGPASEWTASVALYYADLLTFRGEYVAALEVIDRLERDAGADPEIEAGLLLGRSLVLGGAGDPAGGLAAAEQALELQRRTAGAESLTVATTLETLSQLHADLGDLDASLACQEESVRIRGMHEERPSQATLVARCYVASILSMRAAEGDLERAAEILTVAIDEIRRELGEETVDGAWAASLLAGVRSLQEDWEAAEELYRDAIRTLRARLGRHIQVGQTLGAYGRFLLRAKRFEEAVAVLTEALEMQVDLVGVEGGSTREIARDLDAARSGRRGEG